MVVLPCEPFAMVLCSFSSREKRDNKSLGEYRNRDVETSSLRALHGARIPSLYLVSQDADYVGIYMHTYVYISSVMISRDWKMFYAFRSFKFLDKKRNETRFDAAWSRPSREEEISLLIIIISSLRFNNLIIATLRERVLQKKKRKEENKNEILIIFFFFLRIAFNF